MNFFVSVYIPLKDRREKCFIVLNKAIYINLMFDCTKAF